MRLDEAWRHLGIAPTTDPGVVRSAYLSRLRAVHPDVSDAPAANDETRALLSAYRLVVTAIAGPTLDDGPSNEPDQRDGPHPPAAEGDQPFVASPLADEQLVGVVMMANDTIGIGLPPTEAYGVALEAAYRLGDVIHVEPSGGLLQVMLHLRDTDGVPRFCQLLVSLQGRATGVTELHCAVESLDATPAPPIGAVTELLLDELVAGA